MSPSDLASDIRDYCIENTNPDIVAKYSRYFKDGYDAYGLTLEQLEQTVLMILDEGAGFKLVQQTSRILVQSPKYEETSFAILLTKAFEKDFSAKTLDDFEFWFMFGIKNWAHSDVVSTELIYPLLKSKLISIDRLEGWRSAFNKFQRRAVPVSLIKLMKASKDFQLFFEFLTPMMLDKDREVQQGLGWFLREAWKMNKTETEGFLLKWKDTAPRLIFQYATEKMTVEEKKKFRKEGGGKK
jgi:3-methyladenine DNA glycosylase AlkD